jgi:dTMP kinase
MSTIEAHARGGLFITFEGLDGSGKSTQMQLLARHLIAEGFQPLLTVEPGGTAIGAQIRRILLDTQNQALCPTAELLLYFASRAQNVQQVILPALHRDEIVISDRFSDSTLVYQGYGRGLGEGVVADLHRIACGDLTPDLTVLLDIDVETSLRRAHRRNLDAAETTGTRMDEQSVAFYRAVRNGYHTLAQREPQRVRVVDGRGEPDCVAQAVWQAVKPELTKVHV